MHGHNNMDVYYFCTQKLLNVFRKNLGEIGASWINTG